MQADQLYVVSGGASANSLFLEDKICHQIFFDYFNRFISPMAELINYKLIATGWVLLIKTKSKLEIQNAYLEQRNKSLKADRTRDLKESKRMLSEHFRMFLSNFAKKSNDHLGRNGVVVKKRFDRFKIVNEHDYHQQFELICNLQSCNYKQVVKKYQADENQYDEEGLLQIEHKTENVLRSGISVYRNRALLINIPIKLLVVRPYSYVLRKILNSNKNGNKPKTPPPPLE